MALVNINFTVLAHAYVLYARALQSRIRGGTFAAPVRPALKSGTAMRTTVKSGTAFAVPAGPSTPPLRSLSVNAAGQAIFAHNNNGQHQGNISYQSCSNVSSWHVGNKVIQLQDTQYSLRNPGSISDT